MRILKLDLLGNVRGLPLRPLVNLAHPHGGPGRGGGQGQRPRGPARYARLHQELLWVHGVCSPFCRHNPARTGTIKNSIDLQPPPLNWQEKE